MLLLQKKKKILPKPYIFSPLSHIKFSSCLEKHFFFWNCFSPDFTHEKKGFFPENKPKKKNSNIKKKKKKSTHTKVLIWKPCEASVKKYSGVWSTLFFSCVYDLRTGENKVLQGFFLHWYRNVDASSAAASIFYVSM